MRLLLGSLWLVVRSKFLGFWSHFELVWRDPGQRVNHRTWRNHSKEHTGILCDVNSIEYLSICDACLGGCPGFACGVCWNRSVTGIHPLIQLLQGLFILTTQVSLFNLQFHHRRGWENVSLNLLLLQTEINLVTFLQSFYAEALPVAFVAHPSALSPFVSFNFFLSASLFPFLSHIPAIPLQPCTADVSRQEALCTSVHYK